MTYVSPGCCVTVPIEHTFQDKGPLLFRARDYYVIYPVPYGSHIPLHKATQSFLRAGCLDEAGSPR